MRPEARSSHLATQARRDDPERYLCALFAPAGRRDAVLALALLAHELARVPEAVSQPMAGYIRYQWWRDAITELTAGEARAHPVVEVLAEPLRQGWVAAPALLALVDAYEAGLEPPGAFDPLGLERRAAATDGAVQALLHAVLGGTDPVEAAAAAQLGTAFGLVRALAPAAGRRLPHAAVRDAASVIVARAETLLAEGRAKAGRPDRALMPAFLPAALTGWHLRDLRRRAGQGPSGVALRPPASAPLLLGWRVLRRRP